jgi:hypothetical protein
VGLTLDAPAGRLALSINGVLQARARARAPPRTAVSARRLQQREPAAGEVMRR